MGGCSSGQRMIIRRCGATCPQALLSIVYQSTLSGCIENYQLSVSEGIVKEEGQIKHYYLVEPGRNTPSLYALNGRPVYVHLNGLAIVRLK